MIGKTTTVMFFPLYTVWEIWGVVTVNTLELVEELRSPE